MKKLENGRSMIEMLGVLAIIGVLSIGGLAGYTMAMNRHKANNVLDYVSRVAVIAQTNATKSSDTDCNTVLGETTNQYDCTVTCDGNGASATVTVNAGETINALLKERSTEALKIEDTEGGIAFKFNQS